MIEFIKSQRTKKNWYVVKSSLTLWSIRWNHSLLLTKSVIGQVEVCLIGPIQNYVLNTLFRIWLPIPNNVWPPIPNNIWPPIPKDIWNPIPKIFETLFQMLTLVQFDHPPSHLFLVGPFKIILVKFDHQFQITSSQKFSITNSKSYG